MINSIIYAIYLLSIVLSNTTRGVMNYDSVTFIVLFYFLFKKNLIFFC